MANALSKGVKRALLSLTLLLAATDAAAASKVCYPREGDGAVILRSSSSMHSRYVGELDDGSRITVLGRASNARWNRVRDVRGRVGWIPVANVCPENEEIAAPDIARWRNPITNACISSPYGRRRAPTRGASTNHRGCDFGADCGTPIKSAAPGRVIAAGWDGPNGKRVIVEHPDGSESIYAHLQRIRVTPGTILEPATVLGDVGSTGVSTGCHLHFGIRKDGRYVDPQNLIGAADCPTTGRSSGMSWSEGGGTTLPR